MLAINDVTLPYINPVLHITRSVRSDSFFFFFFFSQRSWNASFETMVAKLTVAKKKKAKQKHSAFAASGLLLLHPALHPQNPQVFVFYPVEMLPGWI